MSGNGDSNNQTTQARSSGYIRDFLFGSNGQSGGSTGGSSGQIRDLLFRLNGQSGGSSQDSQNVILPDRNQNDIELARIEENGIQRDMKSIKNFYLQKIKYKEVNGSIEEVNTDIAWDPIPLSCDLQETIGSNICIVLLKKDDRFFNPRTRSNSRDLETTSENEVNSTNMNTLEGGIAVQIINNNAMYEGKQTTITYLKDVTR